MTSQNIQAILYVLKIIKFSYAYKYLQTINLIKKYGSSRLGFRTQPSGYIDGLTHKSYRDVEDTTIRDFSA